LLLYVFESVRSMVIRAIEVAAYGKKVIADGS
jgi:hypothetical protein